MIPRRSEVAAYITDTAPGGGNRLPARSWLRSDAPSLTLDGEWRFAHDWKAAAGLMFVDATIRDGELRGNRVPQVPRHQASAQLSWRGVGAQLRWSAIQYDDDRNELELEPYMVADVFASIPVAAALEATLAIENVFDEDVEVSATPVVSLGAPRAWRVGLRYRP